MIQRTGPSTNPPLPTSPPSAPPPERRGGFANSVRLTAGAHSHECWGCRVPWGTWRADCATGDTGQGTAWPRLQPDYDPDMRTWPSPPPPRGANSCSTPSPGSAVGAPGTRRILSEGQRAGRGTGAASRGAIKAVQHARTASTGFVPPGTPSWRLRSCSRRTCWCA